MVTVISDELLEDLNNGKTINVEIGPLGITLASEKWVKKMEKAGNIQKAGIRKRRVRKEN